MAEMENYQETQQQAATRSDRKRKKRGKGLSVAATVLLITAIVLFVLGGAMGLLYYNNYQKLEEIRNRKGVLSRR